GLRLESSGPVALDPGAELTEAILDRGQAVEIAPGAGLDHELHESIPLRVELGVIARIGPGSKGNDHSAALAGCGRWRGTIPMRHAPSICAPRAPAIRQMGYGVRYAFRGTGCGARPDHSRGHARGRPGCVHRPSTGRASRGSVP